MMLVFYNLTFMLFKSLFSLKKNLVYFMFCLFSMFMFCFICCFAVFFSSFTLECVIFKTSQYVTMLHMPTIKQSIMECLYLLSQHSLVAIQLLDWPVALLGLVFCSWFCVKCLFWIIFVVWVFRLLFVFGKKMVKDCNKNAPFKMNTQIHLFLLS